jgi:hypothetical protein
MDWPVVVGSIRAGIKGIQHDEQELCCQHHQNENGRETERKGKEPNSEKASRKKTA